MLRSKLPEDAKNITAELTKFAQSNDCVDLATSVPILPMPKTFMDCLVGHVIDGDNQYAPSEGIPQLRQSLANYYEKKIGRKYNPETEITITAGASEGIWAAITAVIHEDDEVIIIEPAHENYLAAIRLNGGTPIYVTLRHPNYKIDWNEVIRMINQRTKMIIINTPHSPSGTILCDDDFKKLQKIVVGNKIIVLCDETYSTLCYDKAHISIANYPALAKQSIIIASLSKKFNASGWKTGVCIAPQDITKEIRLMHKYISYGSNTVAQYAIAEFLNKNDDTLDEIRNTYRAKRDLLCSLLENSKYKLTPAEGSWFQLIDISNVTDDSDKDFCLKLAKNFGVVVFPMSSYYHDKNKSSVVRICFARNDETIREGVKRMLNYK